MTTLGDVRAEARASVICNPASDSADACTNGGANRPASHAADHSTRGRTCCRAVMRKACAGVGDPASQPYGAEEVRRERQLYGNSDGKR